MVEASPSSLIAIEGMEVELVDLTWLGESEVAIFATAAGASEEVAGACVVVTAGEVLAGEVAAGEVAAGERVAGEAAPGEARPGGAGDRGKPRRPEVLPGGGGPRDELLGGSEGSGPDGGGAAGAAAAVLRIMSSGIMLRGLPSVGGVTGDAGDVGDLILGKLASTGDSSWAYSGVGGRSTCGDRAGPASVVDAL